MLIIIFLIPMLLIYVSLHITVTLYTCEHRVQAMKYMISLPVQVYLYYTY